MIRHILTGGLLLWALTAQAGSSKLTKQVHEVILDNGMHVLLVKKVGAPNIAAGWVAHVGSANERPGITGISHLFEHMMFKGTPTIGTKNNKLDTKLRTELDAVRGKMFAEERTYRDEVRHGQGKSIDDPKLQSDTMKALKKQFSALLKQQRTNMVKDEFDKVYTEAGASGMNAFTNQDMTVYFVQVPKNKLELWFWMESDRLFHPVFREFYSERKVVYEERRMRTESTPTGGNDEVFQSLFWRGSTYAWPVVGWPSDIAAITRTEAKNYYNTYYAPNNITAAIVGDFDQAEAIKWAKAYFGRIPRGKITPPDVITQRTPQKGEVVYRAKVDDNPSATLAYHTTAFAAKDDPALQVLASVLSGRTGRLYKALVLKDKIATDTSASADGRKYDGMFEISADGTSDTSPDQLRTALEREVARIQRSGISAEELTKVKNQLGAAKYRRLREQFRVLIQLLYIDGLRSWKLADSYFDNIMAVNAQQVQAVAKKYLTEDNRAIKLYSRKQDATPQDPALAKFSSQQKQLIKQTLARIKKMPKDKIPMAIQQLTAAKGKAPANMRGAIDYIISKLHDMAKGA